MHAKSATFALLLVAVGGSTLLTAGCGGGNLYPNTDVIEPSGLEQKVATGFSYTSGNLLASGHMEYEGPGELNPVFRNYIAQMQAHGWMPVNTDVQGDKATGSLRKDTRGCTLTFTQANGRIRAVIVVGPPSGK